MVTYSQTVKMAFQQRENIIIGLTGRTGSGCTTIASILNKDYCDLDLKEPKEFDFLDPEERKYSIVNKYLKVSDHWSPFTIIEGSNVIFSYIIQEGLSAFKKYIAKFRNVDNTNRTRISAFDELYNALDGMDNIFKAEHVSLCNIDLSSDDATIEKYYTFYTKTLTQLKNEFRKLISNFTCHEEFIDERTSQTKYIKTHLYTYLMQKIGNNIRRTGKPFDDNEENYNEKDYYEVC